MKHTTESLVTEMGCRPDWLFAGPNCQQFSSANPEAKGMASTGGDLFSHVCEVVRDMTSAYPSLKYCVENVVPKTKLREETLSAWNSMVPVAFRKLNAASVGAATSRPRMVSTNMVSVAEIRKKPGADPNILLEKGKTDRRTMPCVMTCPKATWAPLRVTDRVTYEERFATNAELMKLMGYQPGALRSGTADR